MLMRKVVGGAGDIGIDPEPADYKDNLYLAVNGDWQKKAQIPSDKSSAGASMELDIDIEKKLMQEFHDFAQDTSTITDPQLLEAVKLYQVANDTDKLSTESFLKDLKKIADIKSLADLNQHLADMVKNNISAPVGLWIDSDMKDTTKNVIYLDGAGLILPDKSYYAKDNKSGQKLLKKYAEVAEKLLTMLGYSESAAQNIVDKALAFDKLLVPIVKSSEEWADYTKIYNPMDFSDLIAKVKNVDLKSMIEGTVNATPEKIIIVQPRYFDNVDKLVNDDNFEDIRAWMMVQYLMDNAKFLTEESRQIVGEYQLALSGAAELPSRVKFAYHLAEGNFDQVVGAYYGKKYFGEKAKAQVGEMIKQMIAIYKQRLADNTWLSEATKQKAIVKLDKIVVKVGYPEKIEERFKKYHIDENLSLYDNLLNLTKVTIQDDIEGYSKPVDPTKWLMPGHMVNACYDPSRNDITFPAGILQPPFYSLQQTSSENYGGIGATIAHEISHAFDNNGAQFDEYGNMNNWWTKEDYSKFQKLTQKMIDQFTGIPYAGGKVNGTLVVSENIADVGGLRCAIEAAKLEPDYDPKQFFIYWAKSWRFKATQEYNENLLATDVHAPQPLRATVMSQDLDEFYDAFDVKAGDGMWLDPKDRVNIW